MPAITPTLLLDTLAARNVTIDAANATNVDDVMQVVCAWPVSGQYGTGSRILYYALVAACVFARKAEWLRNACLAAALVFPAVAALHGIVLAAIHVDTAVDMDVYGAFQFCSIGILAAPLTVRISRTYFYDPARNLIFLWTGIVLAGLLSLTVEFFRINTSPCSRDASGQPISPTDFEHFPYGNEGCNLTCSITAGPFSPLRQKSTDEIYVIPAPNVLTFSAATLLAAACCIPAILSLASMWNKILEINWKQTFGLEDGDELIEGTNGATVERMSRVNTVVRLFLSTVEVPVFSAAVLAILVFGEKNFCSPQVTYQTEPIQSIVPELSYIHLVSAQRVVPPSQLEPNWAPIVGTGLAALGSLYVLLAVDLEDAKEEVIEKAPTHHCNCSHHGSSNGQHIGSDDGGSLHDGAHSEHTSGSPPAGLGISNGIFTGPSHSIATPDTVHLRPSSENSGRGASPDMASTAHRPTMTDVGNRRKVAKLLTTAGNFFAAAQDRFDYSEFKHGKALDFPEVPAEEMRNPVLPKIREAYNHPREDESSTPRLGHRPSRSGSFTGSVASRYSAEGSPTITRAISHPHSRSQSPSPLVLGVRQASTLPAGRASFDLHHPASSTSAGPDRGRQRERRDTLEVPVPMHPSSSRGTQSASPVSSPGITTTITNNQGSPSIVISPDPDTISIVDEPASLSPPVISPPHESVPSPLTKAPAPSP
ncbi:hypothetical protein F4677DRAFT_442764 [Hypoxylon crocopeplum]|nr:hypothetical protein F4677DRAFT_442764 [Hypoxylon crocopeplum]